ncbi:hypothetical protein HDU83_000117 [Entophlyctis luteolus]|nr:hypothetical protein HDU83_000117 [Entophlyctis luteolus]KAJ3394166.1 hypothetical protein HDU84_009486 [Entophlyctis sp. JEL0112]
MDTSPPAYHLHSRAGALAVDFDPGNDTNVGSKHPFDDKQDEESVLSFVSATPSFHCLIHAFLAPAIRAAVKESCRHAVVYLVSDTLIPKEPNFALMPSQKAVPHKFVFIPTAPAVPPPSTSVAAVISPEILETTLSAPKQKSCIDVRVLYFDTLVGGTVQVLCFKNADGTMTYRIPDADNFDLLPESTQAAVIRLISAKDKIFQSNESMFVSKEPDSSAVMSFQELCRLDLQNVVAQAVRLYVPGLDWVKASMEELLLRKVSPFGLMETEVHAMMKIEFAVA